LAIIKENGRAASQPGRFFYGVELLSSSGRGAAQTVSKNVQGGSDTARQTHDRVGENWFGTLDFLGVQKQCDFTHDFPRYSEIW